MEKPSNKIFEIYTRICKEHMCAVNSEMSVDYQCLPMAILEYLDEVHETKTT